MRIAHLGSKGIPSRGGTERVVEAVARRQAERHGVTVYGSRRVCASGDVGGVRVIAVPATSAKHAGPVLLQLVCAAHALTQPYDVVHLHGSENAFVAPLLRLRFPVVTTNHGPAYEREKWSAAARRLIRAVEGLSVRAASAATAVAQNQAEALSRRYGREVAWVPNGVAQDDPVDEESARRLLAGLGVAPGEYWLFAAARVDPTKGCHTLLEAHALMEAPAPLVIVGDLHHAPGYEERLRAAARGGPVHFVPRLDDKATLLGLLRLAQVFVFPSTVEAMSMMLLEAVSVGVPTVAGDIPENTSVLPEGFPLFRAGDAADLARALRELLAQDEAVRAAACKAAARRVTERFRWDAIAQKYEAIYTAVVRGR